MCPLQGLCVCRALRLQTSTCYKSATFRGRPSPMTLSKRVPSPMSPCPLTSFHFPDSTHCHLTRGIRIVCYLSFSLHWHMRPTEQGLYLLGSKYQDQCLTHGRNLTIDLIRVCVCVYICIMDFIYAYIAYDGFYI